MLVERLLATLDKPDPEVDRAWAEESERRLDAYLRGDATGREADDVLAGHLKPRSPISARLHAVASEHRRSFGRGEELQ